MPYFDIATTQKLTDASKKLLRPSSRVLISG